MPRHQQEGTPDKPLKVLSERERTALRPKHLSDIADDSESSEEDDASLHESELSIVEDFNDASETGSEAFDWCSYDTPGNPYEQSLLEGDAQVWQS